MVRAYLMLAALMIIDQFGTICEMHPKIALKKNFLNTKHEHKKTMKNFQLLKKWQHNSYSYPIMSSTIYIPYFSF